MEVERAIVDLYRAYMMKSRIGARFEGTVTAVVGSGLFVQLDAPFVDVLVRLEDLGADRWEIDDDTLRVVAARSGEVIALGDRLLVEIVDVAILRRTVYARRVGASTGAAAAGDERRPKGPTRKEIPRKAKNAKGSKREMTPRRGGKPTRGLPKKKTRRR